MTPPLEGGKRGCKTKNILFFNFNFCCEFKTR